MFPEIARRKQAYLSTHPEADLISLGIGDTTLPIPEHICQGLVRGASKLGTSDGYTGYGAEQGMKELRSRIAQVIYQDRVSADEVFVSDGAKCDIARLQLMFGAKVVSAIQDPSYPVYVDTAVMMGQTGESDPRTRQYGNLVYLPCGPDNGFFPDIAQSPRADVYYICSPNNPTGAVATRAQLEQLVQRAKQQGSIIVYDAAYAPFIRTPGTYASHCTHTTVLTSNATSWCVIDLKGIPKSIFEVAGARDVAIEVNSFSKYAGFTGVRLGWTVVPAELRYSDGTAVRDDWNRVMTTAFNGASNVAQHGGLTCLDDAGLKEIDTLIDYYLTNVQLIRHTLLDLGFKVYGGVDAPYIFVHMKGKGSWDSFNELLEEVQLVTIPGAGFGPGGEGYLRMSAFASREHCVEACERLRKYYSK